MEPSWLDRVVRYLDEVESVARQLDQALQQTSLMASRWDAGGVGQGNASLSESVVALETKVAERDELLHADDAPTNGMSLTEKVLRAGHPESDVIGSRCREVASTIATVNQRAVSLFVVQFHLWQFSLELVRLLTGQNAPQTYSDPNRHEKKFEVGGGLFDEAA